MYKKYSKYRQHFKEQSTYDLGSGARQVSLINKEERRKRAKERIQANYEKNIDRLIKAEDALDSLERKREYLLKKITNAKSADIKEQYKIQLRDCKRKIFNTEAFITQLNDWIQEDKFRLDNLK